MDELLAHPAFQAGVAPFVVALAFASALRCNRMLGLSITAAFALVIALTVGYSFEPTTAMRKLVLVGLTTAVVIPILELGAIPASIPVRAMLAGAAAAAALWLFWRVLQQQDGARAALWGAGAAAYAALSVESSLQVREDDIRAAGSSLMLGLAVGVLAVLGASAVLGQVGIATAAGAGAVLLIRVVGSSRRPSGWTMVLPAAVISALVGLLAVVTGSLPWFCLVPTLAIPWAIRLVANDRHSRPLTAALTLLAGLIPALLAAALAWFTAGTAA